MVLPQPDQIVGNYLLPRIVIAASFKSRVIVCSARANRITRKLRESTTLRKFFRIEDQVEHCKRKNGTERRCFATIYLGDVVHGQYLRCGCFHLSRPDWLAPNWDDVTSEKAAVN